jgi:hypothetical protein
MGILSDWDIHMYLQPNNLVIIQSKLSQIYYFLYKGHESQRMQDISRRYKKERAEYEAELHAIKVRVSTTAFLSMFNLFCYSSLIIIKI